jgi:uncharacterized membrane protein YtjA (UPF0391 family)
MLSYAITFFILAIIAAIFGFGGLAGTLSSIAQFLTLLFVVLFLASLVYGMVTGRRAVPPI